MNLFRRVIRAIVRAVWADHALFRAVVDGNVPLARRALAAGGRPDEPYLPCPPPDAPRVLFDAFLNDPRRGKTPRQVASELGGPGMLALFQAATR